MVDKEGCCLVVTTGGTGPSPRDVTPEATEAVCEKMMPSSKTSGSKEGQASAPPPSQNKASADWTVNTIPGLSDKEEQLDLRKALLEKKIEAELEKAREYTKQKKKPQALQCLKKKKLLENEMTSTVDKLLDDRNDIKE
eukprot:gene17674-24024_t